MDYPRQALCLGYGPEWDFLVEVEEEEEEDEEEMAVVVGAGTNTAAAADANADAAADADSGIEGVYWERRHGSGKWRRLSGRRGAWRVEGCLWGPDGFVGMGFWGPCVCTSGGVGYGRDGG